MGTRTSGSSVFGLSNATTGLCAVVVMRDHHDVGFPEGIVVGCESIIETSESLRPMGYEGRFIAMGIDANG